MCVCVFPARSCSLPLQPCLQGLEVEVAHVKGDVQGNCSTCMCVCACVCGFCRLVFFFIA